MLAAPECGGLLVQGWCARLPAAAAAGGAGEIPAVLESDSGSLEAARMTLAAFPRDDVLAPAVSIVAFARTGGGSPPTGAGGAFGRRAALLPAGGQPGPSGGARAGGGYVAPAADTAAAEGSRAGATGPEAYLPAPLSRRGHDVELVRAGARRQGSAVAVPGVGFLLSGWLLTRHRVSPACCSRATGAFMRASTSDGPAAPADVSEGFADHPLFAGRLPGAIICTASSSWRQGRAGGGRRAAVP